jgi:hypothetical protein
VAPVTNTFFIECSLGAAKIKSWVKVENSFPQTNLANDFLEIYGQRINKEGKVVINIC